MGIALPRGVTDIDDLNELERMRDIPGWKGTGGFTLIELLVIVSFIAILASIAINRYPAVRDLAVDAAAKSDLKNAFKAEEVYYADHGEYVAFEVSDGGSAEEIGFNASQGVSLTATVENGGLRIVGSHASSSKTWCVSSESGNVTEGSSC